MIPALEEIREGLIGARDDDEHDVPNVVRVACQAGILLIDKYSTFAEDCDIYLISIGEPLIYFIYQVADWITFASVQQLCVLTENSNGTKTMDVHNESLRRLKRR